MPRTLFTSIRTRLVLLVLLAVLPALGVMLHTAAEERRLDTERVQTVARRQAAVIASEVASTMFGVRELLLLLTQLPALATTPAGCSAFLANLLAGYPTYDSFEVILPTGEVRCDSLGQAGAVNLGDQEFFRRALATREFVVGDYTVGRATGQPVVTFAQPVVGAGGQVALVAAVSLQIDAINRSLGDSHLPAGASLILLDASGTIVGSYPDAARTGQSPSDNQEAQLVLDAREGVGRAHGPDGQPYLIGFDTAEVRSRDTDLHVVVGIPEAVALAPANQALARSLALLGAAATLALLAAWYAGDRLVARPVQRLVRATRELSGGDLSVRVGPSYGDGELGALGRAFDSMTADLESAYLNTVEVLADAVETRDPYTGGHVSRVADYSLAIARELGWDKRQLVQLHMAAALHDVGKIGVPDAVLRKQGPLDDQELPVMRSHTNIGATLLDGVPFLTAGLECALSHQEFYNGKGYPRGLAGEAIGADARVVAIADTFDAMTTTRPYRKGLPLAVALAEIQKCAGTQFDPTMVAAFMRAVEKGAIAVAPSAAPDQDAS
jgi:HD-GYP domain-containing protein (c-di-GMP phosphodiesterase class II)